MLLCDLFNPFYFRTGMTDHACAVGIAAIVSPLLVLIKFGDNKLQIGKNASLVLTFCVFWV